MYITPSQLEARLKGQTSLELKKRDVGKKVGSSNLTHEERVLVGIVAQHDTQANAAALVGTSQANVSFISRGLSGDKVNEELKKDIEEGSKTAREQVSERALDLLMQSLEVVNDKKDVVRNAVDATTVAKNLAIISEKMQPRDSNQGFLGGPRIQINIHGSKQRSEEDFEALEVVSSER